MGTALHAVTGRAPDGRWLRAGVLAAVFGGLILPILAGLAETARAAFGLMAAAGAGGWNLEPWGRFAGLPGLGTSLTVTLTTGVGATLLSLVLAAGFCAATHGRLTAWAAGRLLAPFLAAPHAAVAIGLAFVIAPSGWIARALAPLVGWDRPPELVTVHDPWGLALTAGLVVKEVPFLALVMLTALTRIPVRAQLAAGRSLGYAPGAVWLKAILPQIWPLIRLPVWAVLAYSLSVVDMAMILGPSNPPTLAVMLTRMFGDPDVQARLPASAGALVQGVIVLAACLALWLSEGAVARLGLGWLRRGGRGRRIGPAVHVAALAAAALLALGALAMTSMALWSLAWRWPFPRLLPETWSLRAWGAAGAGWLRPLGQTLMLAGATTLLSLVLAIAWLEGEDRGRMVRAGWAEALIYAPLLVPQIAFVYGLNVAFLSTGLPDGLAAVVWAQVLFVFPYLMIALSDPWRSLDPRLLRAAASLGAGPTRRLLAVKLPILLSPLLTAAAIGIAVSVAQYLPTLFLGGGRIATLTTEAVALSSASDRRIAGVYATLQAALPFLAYLAAFAVPAVLHRNRRGLRGGRHGKEDPT